MPALWEETVMPKFRVWCEGSGDVICNAEYETREKAQFHADQQHLRTRYKGYSVHYIVRERPEPFDYTEADISP